MTFLLTVLLSRSRLWIVFVMWLNVRRATLMCYSHDSRNWIPTSGEMMGAWILLPVCERKGTCKTKGWDITNALPFLDREKARYEDDRYAMYYIRQTSKQKANVIWSYNYFNCFSHLCTETSDVVGWHQRSIGNVDFEHFLAICITCCTQHPQNQVLIWLSSS